LYLLEGESMVKLNNRIKWFVGVAVMIAVTVGAAAYAQDYGKNEIVHFWLAVPAGNVTTPQVLRGAGPPISLSPLNIDLDARGILKNLIQPNVEALSTHWIYNLGKTPVRIQMDLINCSIPVAWEVSANFPYDAETRTFTQPLMPGSSIQNLGIDWIFDIPSRDEVFRKGNDGLVFNGGLLLSNADTGEILTLLPIKIGYGQESFGGASCCD
jgi:hypothetical protein